MAKRILMRSESNKSSRSGSVSNEISFRPSGPSSNDVISGQSTSPKHYDSESAIWKDVTSESGSVSNSYQNGSSKRGSGIEQGISVSAQSSKRNSDIALSEVSVTNLTEESIDSVRNRDQLGGIEEYALETQFEYTTEEVASPRKESAVPNINSAREENDGDQSNKSTNGSSKATSLRSKNSSVNSVKDTNRGIESQFETNDLILENETDCEKRSTKSHRSGNENGRETSVDVNEVVLRNKKEDNEKTVHGTRYVDNGQENQYRSNELVLQNDIEFETYREVVKRRNKQAQNQKQEYTLRADALDWNDSSKRLISESSESSSARNSSVISEASLDFENVLYTESEHSSKHHSIAADTLERKEKQNEKGTGISTQQETQKEERKPTEIARRFVQNKKQKTDTEYASTSNANKTGDKLPQQDITQLQNTLYSGGFQNHTRVFKPKPKAIVAEKKETVKKFSAIHAEVPPPKRQSSFEYNLSSSSSSGYPITLSKSQADLLTSQRVILTKSKSMTSLNGTGPTRYSIRGLSALPNDVKVVAVPQEMQRRTLQKARKAIEMAISNFDIKFDSESTHFHPGSPITGKVMMDVWNTVEIRYVEFVLQGRATVRVFGKDGKFTDRPHNENYLQKRIILLSPPSGELTMTLAPGKYVSEFAYKLPEALPATVGQADVSDTCVFSVTYSARANVCDFLHARHIPQSERYAQVMKSCKKEFKILPAHDLRSVPGAMEPIVHAEQFNVMCTPLSTANTSVLVKLDHQLFAIGDVMNLSLEVCTPDPKRIKGITANMVQTVIFQPPVNRKYSRTVIKAIDVQRYQKQSQNGKSNQNGYPNKNTYRCSFGIPIPVNLIPSVLMHAHIIQVNYRMDIKVTFKNLGGALNMSLPVILTSATEPNKAGGATVPLFNKPIMQFPYFSRGPLRDSAKSNHSQHSTGSRNGQAIDIVAKSDNVGQKHERVRADYVSCFSF